MISDALSAEKARLRRTARETRRQAYHAEAGAALGAVFPSSLLGLAPVGGYWPLGNEIDPRPLMLRLLAGGAPMLLPRIPARHEQPVFLPWRPEAPLAPDAFGILAPTEGEPAEPRLILLPLLAFDRSGVRLGQGGGHYDRVLAGLRPKGVIAVGLAFAAQELPAVPREAHDQELDWVLTEREAIRCG